MDKIEVGSTVKDSLTIFQGTVIARCEYLYDNPSLLVVAPQSVNVEGKPSEMWLQEARCMLLNPPTPSV
jgi:hypothetical protein